MPGGWQWGLLEEARVLPQRLLYWLATSGTIEIAGSELVERTKELIEEGNVRCLIIRTQDDKVLLEVPLTAGVAVGGVVTLVAPVLATLGALAALVARVKVEIVRTGGRGEK